jgi:hypothetical protein
MSNTQPFTFSMKTFGADPTAPVEEFYAIDNNTVVFNQDLVESASIIDVNATLAAFALNLKDGTSITTEFTITDRGVLTHRMNATLTKH